MSGSPAPVKSTKSRLLMLLAASKRSRIDWKLTAGSDEARMGDGVGMTTTAVAVISGIGVASSSGIDKVGEASAAVGNVVGSASLSELQLMRKTAVVSNAHIKNSLIIFVLNNLGNKSHLSAFTTQRKPRKPLLSSAPPYGAVPRFAIRAYC